MGKIHRSSLKTRLKPLWNLSTSVFGRYATLYWLVAALPTLISKRIVSTKIACARHRLPRLTIQGNTEQLKIPGDVCRVSLEYTNSQGEKKTCFATMEIYGNKSLSFRKKSFILRFFDESYTKARSVDLGLGGGLRMA